jgi:hypothetical protein
LVEAFGLGTPRREAACEFDVDGAAAGHETRVATHHSDHIHTVI